MNILEASFFLVVFQVQTPSFFSGKNPDWLIDPDPYKASIQEEGDSLVLGNGLLMRKIRVKNGCATVAFDNLVTGECLLRSVRPEAMVGINGKEWKVGGLVGQVEHAYIKPEWLERMVPDESAFRLKGYRTGKTEKRFEWKRMRWHEKRPWPPPGKSLTLVFAPPDEGPRGIEIRVHYEIYDGIPLISKWFVLENNGKETITIDSFKAEILALVEGESSVKVPRRWRLPNIHVETDYEFNGSSTASASKAVFWEKDPLYRTQVNYRRLTPCLLVCKPPLGPAVEVRPGEKFESFRVFELVYDSTERERKSLSLRRMFRVVAPWVTENPIFFHLRSTDPKVVRTVIDQCADVGFEMIILSFGSGLNMESSNPAYIGKIKELGDYARSKGIELGGYSLLASRRISEKDDVINPKTGRRGGAIFGNSPCLLSEWGINYFKKIKNFIESTGFSILEHDGSYPGDVCASRTHPGHKGLEDSQWKQWKKITDFYKWCRARGVYLNVPDWYFLSGSNKIGMGYREVNWSLPRERQIILARQNIFDGTWEKTPSMGWMFVPLVQYHGGGKAATLEPLCRHLKSYEAHLALNFGAGVQACYRGTRIYDTKETKDLVKRWVAFYKRHRSILNSDIIHVRRPDGRKLDCILHVNPRLEEKAFAMIYNPGKKAVEDTIRLNLYYAGIDDKAEVTYADGCKKIFALDRFYNINVPVEVGPAGYTYLSIK